MANVQKQFDEFDENIRIGRFKESKELRDKRDIIRGKLNERLPTVFEEHGETCPPYSFCDLGSYSIGTGIKPPEEGDFDIDQGIFFQVAVGDYEDPVVLKERVFEALDGHTKSVIVRRPCVTVQYQRGEEPVYHVDIAVYSDRVKNPDGQDRLAMGKLGSSDEYRIWRPSGTRDLKDTVLSRFDKGGDRNQFRRAVRYLKRWKDHKFPVNGNAAPPGVGLTVATYNELVPAYSDPIAGKPDDLGALRSLVRSMLSRFSDVWDPEEKDWVRRLVVRSPVLPGDDFFERMTRKQMESFEEKLKSLRDVLDDASAEVDPAEACELLQQQFGSAFPVPDKVELAKAFSTPAIVSHSSSGEDRWR